MKFFLFLVIFFGFGYAQELRIYTEELPPYNYTKNGEVVGVSTIFLQHIMKEYGEELKKEEISIGSWSRGYEEALKEKNSMIYSTARTQEREKLFAWVGPIDQLIIGVIAKKSKNIKITSPKELNSYKIGTLHRTAAEQLLREVGVDEKNLDRFANIKSQLKKLEKDRVDLVAFGYEGMKFVQRELGIDTQKYELVYVLKKADLYYAFHKDTDKKFIEDLNKIVQKLHQSKEYSVKAIKESCGL